VNNSTEERKGALYNGSMRINKQYHIEDKIINVVDMGGCSRMSCYGFVAQDLHMTQKIMETKLIKYVHLTGLFKSTDIKLRIHNLTAVEGLLVYCMY